jgi:hypothetical protein
MMIFNTRRNNRAAVSSQASRSDGTPLFHLVSGTSADASSTAQVGSFEYLNRVLKLSDEHKLKELQAVIQGI